MHTETVTLDDGTLLDVSVLKRIAVFKVAQSLPIRFLRGLARTAESGFCKIRLHHADPIIPLIVRVEPGRSRCWTLLDGRHRALKLLEAKCRKAPCIVLTQEECLEALIQTDV